MRLAMADFPGIGSLTETTVREIYSRLPKMTDVDNAVQLHASLAGSLLKRISPTSTVGGKHFKRCPQEHQTIPDVAGARL